MISTDYQNVFRSLVCILRYLVLLFCWISLYLFYLIVVPCKPCSQYIKYLNGENFVYHIGFGQLGTHLVISQCLGIWKLKWDTRCRENAFPHLLL